MWTHRHDYGKLLDVLALRKCMLIFLFSLLADDANCMKIEIIFKMLIRLVGLLLSYTQFIFEK